MVGGKAIIVPHLAMDNRVHSTIGNMEQLIRVMKNKLMNHFKKSELPCYKSTYVMYTLADWEDFAEDKSITCAKLESWLDKSYATIMEKMWIKN